MIKLWRFLSVSIVLAVCLGLLLVPAVVGVSAGVGDPPEPASGKAAFRMPAEVEVLPGETFLVNVTIYNPNSVCMTWAALVIEWDSASLLSLNDVAEGDWPLNPVGLKWPQPWSDATDNFTMQAGQLTPGTYQTGTITHCAINFTAANTDGVTTVRFSHDAGEYGGEYCYITDPGGEVQDWSAFQNMTVKIGTPNLTVNVSPAGKGTVTINNTITPTLYPNITTRTWNEVVELNATATVANWTFDHWSGDLTGSDNPTNITMNSTKSVVAHFTRYNLTVTNTTGGTVTEPGVGIFRCAEGESVTLVATKYTDYGFVNWTGDVGTIGDVNASSTFITMTGDYSICANFAGGIGATLEGHVSFPMARVGGLVEPFLVKLFEHGNLSHVMWTGNATTNDTGVFTIPDIDPDTYDIGIKNATCLSELDSSVTLTAGETEVVNFTIREGDVDPTDYVDMGDYADFSYAFRTSPTDVKWNANADLDRSGYIDMGDYAMFSYNFREMGDAYGHF